MKSEEITEELCHLGARILEAKGEGFPIVSECLKVTDARELLESIESAVAWSIEPLGDYDTDHHMFIDAHWARLKNEYCPVVAGLLREECQRLEDYQEYLWELEEDGECAL